MGKHSKQASTRGFFTSGERQASKGRYGTIVARLGTDSQRRFDQCNLCLDRLRDPVATPSGNLYCRECIIKNLLAQSEALAVQRKAYETYKAAKEAELVAAEDSKKAAALRQFASLESGIASAGIFKYGVPTAPAGALEAGKKDVEDLAKSMAARVDPRTREEKQTEVEKASFWIPAATPESDKTVMPTPDPAPRDPVSGDFLRAKQLVSLHLALAKPPKTDEEDTGVGVDEETGATGKYMCPACMKAIVFQQTYLFRNCGHVFCDKCVAQFVIPSKQCFSCNGTVVKSDVIKLQRGGSAFAGNEGTQSEAKKYEPTLIT